MTQLLFDLKCRVARSQLSTALDLFIRDQDPVAVHCLACGGAEVIESLAKLQQHDVFADAMEAATNLTFFKIVGARNRYWNAFKHLTSKDGKTLRTDDVLLLDTFDDTRNDAALYCGWYDYMILKQRLPVEVQVFQIWYGAITLGFDHSDEHGAICHSLFPGIERDARSEQKRRLRVVVDEHKDDIGLLADRKTEPVLLRL